MSLEDLITRRIRSQGPLTVAEYMEIALTHPEYGYYMRRDPLGRDGDFITAPEISQIFGELIGAWLAGQWIVMGRPPAALAELGPGRGTLMADALRATRRIPGFHDALSVHLVEASPVLRQKQQSLLKDAHPRLHWHTSIDELPPKPLLLAANEFFDALPIRQFAHTESGWRERVVGLEDNRLAFVMAEIPPVPLRQWIDTIHASPGMTLEYSEAARAILRAIARHCALHGGAALIIDYGYGHGSRGDTLQAVKQHRYHDVLAEPGMADLTAHVDFAALKESASASGAQAYGPAPQGKFLAQMGAPTRIAMLCRNATPQQKSAMLSGLERLTSPEEMGDLFKLVCVTHPDHPKPAGF